MSLVYCITNNINKKSYVGQTTRDLEMRISQHVGDAIRGSSCVIHNAIRKYGWDNFTYFAWHVSDDQELLNQFEIGKIKELNTLAPNGYNMVQGGNVPPNRKGIKRPDQSKRLMGKSNKGKNNPNAKAIILIHPDGTKEKFYCMMDACRKYDLNKSHLTSVKNGRRNTHKGFKCENRGESYERESC